MRTEKEMMDLIIGVAQQDERIRAVYMNGSRANKNVPKDIFQDYDIVYVVNETVSFQEDKKWIDRFGERLYMQYPEDNEFIPHDRDNCYGWLIQFSDGNRLDLHVSTLKQVKIDIDDKMYIVLLDKDNCIQKCAEPTDEFFWVKKPSEVIFQIRANEFWWCLNNVAKGLWRKEPTYVLDMLNYYIRTELVEMLSYKVGVLTDFSVSIGKSGKYMYRWLPAETWERFLSTYCGADIDEIWKSVFIMCDLFDETAKELAEIFKYKYDEQEAANSRLWLMRVKATPSNAVDIAP